MSTWQPPPIPILEKSLENPQNPIGMRMRAAYYLRHIYETSTNNTPQRSHIIQILGRNLRNPHHGSLLRHEFAYVMGQLHDSECCPYLEETLSDGNDCIMTRHECAEALGAIGNFGSLRTLKEYAMDESVEVGETCQIAVDYIEWKLQQQQQEGDDDVQQGGDSGIPPVAACACMISPYNSIDPAPPEDQDRTKTDALGETLSNPKLPLFERYRAMFTLRNRNTPESAKTLGNVLVSDTSSALLRHEIAYVLGQMQNAASVPMLIESLRRTEEHGMVRHESAEALGAMCEEGMWEECEGVLREFMNDGDVCVRESCEVALDAADYWGALNDNDEDDEELEDKKVDDVITKTIHDDNGLYGKNRTGVLLNHFNVVQTN